MATSRIYRRSVGLVGSLLKAPGNITRRNRPLLAVALNVKHYLIECSHKTTLQQVTGFHRFLATDETYSESSAMFTWNTFRAWQSVLGQASRHLL